MNKVQPLDDETLSLFDSKGIEDPVLAALRSRNGNAVKVRRVLQIIHDLARRPFDQLRILDLACGEGVYAIEMTLCGASVVALDARTERMDKGVAI
jgi:2-polyprenyl-3-methyl-5-hydroxy-6-metoxy-1,4-benzoquinol methylase